MYYIGIDGGGTKTRFACYHSDGRMIGEIVLGGTYYRQDGIQSVAQTLEKGIEHLRAGADSHEFRVCFGMPGYGENGAQDEKAAEAFARHLAPQEICFRNDVAAGWAGALALCSGINIVGGTGSMSYGRDDTGKEARCGGWSEYFSDEGSGYWLGKKALELFARQADCRAPKGALYEIVRDHFSLADDYALIGIIEREYAPSRKKTASLQWLLCKAAEQGDPIALECYRMAAKELALIVCGTAQQLAFGDKCIDVSYVGGLFNERELILNPMTEEIQRRINANVIAPRLSPCEGAALFAAERFTPEALEGFRSALLQARDCGK